MASFQLVAFSRAFVRFSFATINKTKFTSPPGHTMWIFEKNDFLEHREKRSEFDLGSAFFGISDLGFLPYGVPIKGVIEKGLIFDEKC